MRFAGHRPDAARPLPFAELASLPDERLMAELVRGQNDALAVLFDRYHRLVLNVALRVLRDAGEAEDLLQAVFLEIFRSAAQFDAGKGTTKVWILQYAYHRSFNRRQYLNLRGLYERPEDFPVERSRELPPEHGLGVLDSGRLVQQALGRLSKVQSQVLELAFYEGLTMREIALRTGDSFDSVRHHYYRGLEKLRGFLCTSRDFASDRAAVAKGVTHVEPQS